MHSPLSRCKSLADRHRVLIHKLVERLAKEDGGCVKDLFRLVDANHMLYPRVREYLTCMLRVARSHNNKLKLVTVGFQNLPQVVLIDVDRTSIPLLENEIVSFPLALIGLLLTMS